jgi:uncharacterized protein (TIGR02449 family)
MDASSIAGAIGTLTVAGAAQVRMGAKRFAPLLPVELRHANHTASTNLNILAQIDCDKPYNIVPMLEINPLDQITERVERLLTRHAELQRSNALLHAQVNALTTERNSLASRLNAARARIDALLDRLPSSAPPTLAPTKEPHEAN